MKVTMPPRPKTEGVVNRLKALSATTCDPSRSKGSSDNKSSTSSSSASSSNKARTPGKYDKYKAKDDGKNVS